MSMVLLSIPPGLEKALLCMGESHRYLRTNTDKTNFLSQFHKLQNNLLSRGYEARVIKPLLRRVRYKDRHKIIHKNKKETEQGKGTPTLVLTYNTHIPRVWEALNQIWQDFKQDPLLNELYPEPPRIALKKNPSLGNLLVRARLKKQTPRTLPKDSQPINTYQHCSIPADYPKNIRKQADTRTNTIRQTIIAISIYCAKLTRPETTT